MAHRIEPETSLFAEETSAPSNLRLPDFALAIIDALESEGFESWAVGGFVRDSLLGTPCADIDIATAAHWSEVKRICERQGMRTHETGVKHGTLTVVVGDDAAEVTTFRTDGASSDSRHPDRVEFVRTIEEDLARRDFTINALAYHPKRGLLDLYGGEADLRAGIIRAVGAPEKRFAEDALRILRACRFAAQLGFSIEEETYKGMLRNKGLLHRVSAERVHHELSRLLLGEHAGETLMRTVDALAAVLPELVAMKGFDQRTPYHIYDVLEHTAHVVDGVPPYPLARWAALFHDMGKPATFFTDDDGRGHFYGHAFVSVELARGVMARLKMAPAFQSRVLALVERHDDVIEPAPRAVKRALARLGGDTELFRALCDLKRGDARGQAPQCAGRIALADELVGVLEQIEREGEAFSLKKLAVSGNDVLALGIAPGPAVGRALACALDAVIDERVPNEREALQGFLRTWTQENAEAGEGD